MFSLLRLPATEQSQDGGGEGRERGEPARGLQSAGVGKTLFGVTE